MRRYFGVWMTGAVAAVALGGCASEPCGELVPPLLEVAINVRFESHAWDIHATDDGGFILTGNTSTEAERSGEFEDYAATFDAHLVKVDRAGAVEWRNTYGGPGADVGRSVRPTGDGGYILVGHSGAPIFDFEQVDDPSDLLIVKVDGSGNEVWMRRIEGNPSIAAHSVYVDSDGGFVVAGHSSEFVAGGGSAILMKFDAEGDALWQRHFGAPGRTTAKNVVAARGGGFVLAGFSFGGVNASRIWDIYVVKTDEEGNAEWTFEGGDSFPIDGYRRGEGIVETADGGFAIVGTASDDLFVAKLDASGGLVWLKTAPGAPHANGYAIVETSDGSLVAVGESYSRDGFGIRYCRHYYAVRFGAQGELLWDGRLGDSEFDIAYGVAEADDGNIVLAGTGSDGTRYIYLVFSEAGRSMGRVARYGIPTTSTQFVGFP